MFVLISAAPLCRTSVVLQAVATLSDPDPIKSASYDQHLEAQQASASSTRRPLEVVTAAAAAAHAAGTRVTSTAEVQKNSFTIWLGNSSRNKQGHGYSASAGGA